MKECITHHHACDCREENFKKLEKENTRLRSALDSVVAKSYSWVITRESAELLGPVHSAYREIAKQALEEKP